MSFKWLFQLSPFFLCVGALCFPFSVAATNVALGLALGIGILSGQWWQGVISFWRDYKTLMSVFLCYFLLMMVGMIWSQDVAWGIHILGRQWFWLLLPVVIAVLSGEQWRLRFLMALSIGLTLNLFFCVLQMFSLVEVTTVGSTADDATGHIGHIGFGVVYGIWGAWLLHLGWIYSAWQRLYFWGMASWAYLMVFMALGRAGLVVATVLMMSIVFFHVRKANIIRLMVGISLVVALIVLGVVLGSHKDRWLDVWHGIESNASAIGVSDKSSDIGSSTDQRFYMAMVSLDVWKKSPLLGVGTGGLPEAVREWSQEGGHVQRFLFVHPHNQYLLNLVRWGPLGVFLLLLLLYVWGRESWRWNWEVSTMAPLIFLSSSAIALHGLVAPSMEEHFSALLAVLMLGVGLSDRPANQGEVAPKNRTVGYGVLRCTFRIKGESDGTAKLQ